MSKLYENEIGLYISHEQYINRIYKNITDYTLNSNLFNINELYKKQNKLKSALKIVEPNNEFEDLLREQKDVKQKFSHFFPQIEQYLMRSCLDNKKALETSDHINSMCEKFSVVGVHGSNIGPAMVKEINGTKFIFPENTEFYSKDVCEINKYLNGRKFDLILLDPPWWNKYIRRKRKKTSDGYNMMFNEDLKSLPIDSLLSEDGLLVVWCTNSRQNLNALLNNIFPHWQVHFIAKWYWLKITKSGEPICEFSQPPGKQPYEKIIFASRKCSTHKIQDGRILVSIPSILHSHKPPLVEVLEEYLSKDAKCLEVFARYLLPGWTSYGNEVLKLQHESLFIHK